MGADDPRAATSLLCVTIRQLLQLCIDNDLLFFSLLAIIELIATDGFAILEHPAEPRRKDAASRWRTPILRALAVFPQIQTVRFAQGLMGSATPKPTSLVTRDS